MRPVEESIFERLFRTHRARLHEVSLRPTSPDEIVGQDDALEILRTLLGSPAPPHVILQGPPGVGKSTLARMALTLAKESGRSQFADDAPFVEADGASMMHDMAHRINALTSYVVEATYSGVTERANVPQGCPEINFGAVAQAHLGVLFVDEIGELPAWVLNALLKVLEEGRERITSSSYALARHRAPQWMRTFFEGGIPADFVLLGATTRSISELPPALVSKCEIVRLRPLSYADRVAITRNAARKLELDLSDEAAELLGRTTSAGRDAARRLELAAARASNRGARKIEARDIPRSIMEDRIGFR
ncbi:MAG: ATP-binding protein [Vulcanimicrobiaceae bacterium]